MRLGLIARAENRGLGLQTWEFFRHMRPERTLVVDLGELARGVEQHLDRFPGARVANWSGGELRGVDVDWLLAGCDVLYTAETPYDYGLLTAARERGVRTVVQGNFEFLRWAVETALPRPDLFLAPSTWHLDRWPAPVLYLPFPVDRERLPFQRRERAETFVHIVGRRAMQDRNGTRLALGAAGRVRAPGRMIVRSQGRMGRGGSPYAARSRPFRLEVAQGDVPNYWDLYIGADALVLPRRYGGQCLPMNEALSLGMPIVALDREPERSYLPAEGLARARRLRWLRTQGGEVEWFDSTPRDVAQRIEQLAASPELVARLSDESDRAAQRISWEVLAPVYREVLKCLHESGAEAAREAGERLACMPTSTRRGPTTSIT